MELTTAQIIQMARHPERPYFLDYVAQLFTEFEELSGDRAYSRGPSIIGGVARFEGQPVMVIGHQKGRKTSERVERNFGMPQPEDYRKTQRLMKLAEKFSLPLFTFIDTAGAYPGIEAEAHNQSEAIARNLFLLSHLKTRIICTITGEGGSGGALALAVGDLVNMLEYSIYSVITPEGCASILWKSIQKSQEAAEAMGVTAGRIQALGLIDEIIPEPAGGAQADLPTMIQNLRKTFSLQLTELLSLTEAEVLERRYRRIRAYGL